MTENNEMIFEEQDFADVDSLTEASRKLLNYVAISRAETLLYVFYSNKVEEDRQSLMVKGYAKLNQGQK